MKRRLRRHRGRFKFTDYYKTDTSPSSDDQRGRRRSRRSERRRFGFIFSALLVSAFIIFISLFGLVVPIDIKVDGADEELESRLGAATEEWLQANLLRRFKPLVDGSALTGVLSQEFASIQDLSVDTSVLSRGITIKGNVRLPVLYMEQDGQTILFDSSGAAFTNQDYDQIADEDLPRVVDRSAISQTADIATIGLPEAITVFIRDLNRIITEKDSQSLSGPITVYIEDEPRTVVWQPNGAAYEVLLATNRDPLDQIEEYEALLGYLDERSIRPPSDYIDIRVDDTAYYQ